MALTGAGASEEVQVAVGGDATGFNSALDGALSKLGDFDTKLGIAGGAVAAFGGVIAADAVGAAADFDAAMTESLAIMDDVTEAMEQDMAEAAREVATETTFSAEQAAESYFFLASAGMDAEEVIEALPEVAEFAQAGMFDMAEATDILTDAQSALGEENIELAELGDMLVAANQEANASVEEFGTALTNKAAPAMERLSVETEEGVGALAAFADQGLKGERAGTILARTLEGLETQARTNEEEFEELGVSVFDAEGEMRDLQDIIVDLEDGLDGMSTKQRQAALDQLGFNDRASQGLDLLIGNSEQLGEYGEALADSGGAAEDVAEKQLDTLSARWELLRSQIDDLRIALGEQFLPALEGIVDGIAGAVEAFGAFNDMTDGAAAKVGLLAPTIAGALVALAVFGPALAGAALAAAPLIAAFVALSAVVAAVLIDWDENLFGIQEITEDVFETISDVVEDAIEFVWEDVIEPTLEAIQDFWEEHGDDIIEFTEEAFETVADVVEDVVTFVWEDVIEPILSRIQEFWDDHGDNIISTVESFLDTVADVIETTMDLLWNDLIEPMLRSIQQAWDEHGEEIVADVQTIFGTIADIVERVMEFVWHEIIDPILSAVQALWDEFGEDVLDIVETALETLTNVFDEGLTILFEIIDFFTDLFTGDFEGAKESVITIFEAMFNILEEVILGAVSIIRTAVTAVIDAIIGVFQSLVERVVGNSLIPDMIDDIVDIFLSAPRAVRDAVWDVADAILDPIESVVDDAVEFASGLPARIADALTSAVDGATDFLGDMAYFGVGLIDGIASGVSDAASSLIDAILSPLNRGIELVNDALVGVEIPEVELGGFSVDTGSAGELPGIPDEVGIPSFSVGGQTLIEDDLLSPVEMAHGGIVEGTGLVEITDPPETVLPRDVRDLPASTNSAADSGDLEQAIQRTDRTDELLQKLDRIADAIRDDGTIRVSERDVLRGLARMADRNDVSL